MTAERDSSGLIMHVITGLQLGGAETALYRLLAADDRQRRVPLVVSLGDRGAVGPRLEQLGVEVVALGMRPGRPSVSGMRALVRLMRERRPDVIQGWMYHGNLVAGVASRWARSSAPLIWNVRHAVPDLAELKPSTAMVVRLGRRFRSVRRIVYNSGAAAEQHEALGYPADKTRVIPNGFDTQAFRPSSQARRSARASLGLEHDAPLIGLVARFHPHKDHATFFAAVRKLQQHPGSNPAHFVLLGAGVDPDTPELAALADALPNPERVHLLGARDDVPRWTAALDVATSSSTTEAFPNALGEAMACGVPCVATDVGDVRELLGATGVVVQPGDPAALATGWRTLLEASGESRRKRGVDARARIEQRFAMSRVVERYAALVDDVLMVPSGEKRGDR